MASKMVLERTRRTRELVAAAREHGRVVSVAFGAQFGGRWQGDLQEERARQLVQEIAGRCERLAHALVAADEDRVVRLEEARQLRLRRDEAMAHLLHRLGRVRHLAQAVLGDDQGKTLVALEGRLGRDPEVVLRRARRVIARLGTGAFGAATNQAGSLRLDVEALLAELEASSDALEAVLREIASRERDAQGRIGEAATRLVEFDLAYGQAARLLEAIFTYAGRDDLARRLRRPRRQRRKPAPGESLFRGVNEGEAPGEKASGNPQIVRAPGKDEPAGEAPGLEAPGERGPCTSQQLFAPRGELFRRHRTGAGTSGKKGLGELQEPRAPGGGDDGASPPGLMFLGRGSGQKSLRAPIGEDYRALPNHDKGCENINPTGPDRPRHRLDSGGRDLSKRQVPSCRTHPSNKDDALFLFCPS